MMGLRAIVCALFRYGLSAHCCAIEALLSVLILLSFVCCSAMIAQYPRSVPLVARICNCPCRWYVFICVWYRSSHGRDIF